MSNTNKKYIVDITYETFSPKDLEVGYSDNHGFEKEDIEFDSLKEVVDFAKTQYGHFEYHGDDSLIVVDGEQDYMTGSITYYGVHINNLTQEDRNELDTIIRNKGQI